MNKIITTSILSIALIGVTQSFALTPYITPPPMLKSGVKTDAPASREEYIKKVLAEGKITQSQADSLLKSSPRVAVPVNVPAATSTRMIKYIIPESKDTLKKGDTSKGVMTKEPKMKQVVTPKKDTTKMGKLNSNTKPTARPFPDDFPKKSAVQTNDR